MTALGPSHVMAGQVLFSRLCAALNLKPFLLLPGAAGRR